MTKKTENKILLWQIFCTILGILLIFSILTKGFIGCPTPTDSQIIEDKNEEKEKSSDEEKIKEAIKQMPREQIDIEGDYVIGLGNAKVTIVEFSNFQCSACKNHYAHVYPQILEELINTGKANYILKPLGLERFTEAVECANEQGKYEEMHEELFSNRINADSLEDYAKNIGLNTEEFNECINSGKFIPKAQEYQKEASNANIRGTPIFFVNGIRLEGTYPFETFKKIADIELED